MENSAACGCEPGHYLSAMTRCSRSVVLDRVVRRARAKEAERAACVAFGFVELLRAQQRLSAPSHGFEALVGR